MSVYLAERLADDQALVYPADDSRWIWEPVQEAVRRSGLGPDAVVRHPLTVEDATPRSERPTLRSLAPDRPSGVRNQMTQHPPAYYTLAGAALLMADRAGPLPYDLQVVILRLLGIALLAPLPAVCALTARRIGVDESGALLAALVPVGVPMLSHIGASVNNDILLIGLMAAMTPLLLCAATARIDLTRSLLVGALGGAALLTKGFGLVVPAWIAAAFAVGVWRSRRATDALLGAVAVGIAVGLGGWWWLRNVVVTGQVQPHHHHLPTAGPDFVPDWLWWSGFASHRFVTRFWVEPDIVHDGAMPWELVAALCLGTLVVVGAVSLIRGPRLAEACLLVFPFASIAALVMYGAIALYANTGAPFGIHGRYTYPGLVGLAALAALGSKQLGRSQLLLPLAAVGTVLLQARTWWLALNHYWAGTGAGDSLRAMLAWSPLPPSIVVAAALFYWTLLLFVLAMALLRLTSDGPPRMRRQANARAG